MVLSDTMSGNRSNAPESSLEKGRILARGLTKRYTPQNMRSGSVKELILRRIRRALGRRSATAAAGAPVPDVPLREVVALAPLDLDVAPGETLGVIGGNGSGKSTLLKLLAGITPPTGGNLRIGGRVAALMELGVGFHPDLSGLENIFLLGSLLGVPRGVIRERLDAIVAFADIGAFIHAPVRNYSTGMTVRLGFAVATHMDPDVILLDEVISVGDADFQTKSFDRIRQMKRRGVTILVVSHQIDAIERICDRVLWLKNGAVEARGDVFDVLYRFEHLAHRPAEGADMVACDWSLDFHTSTLRMGSGEVVAHCVELLDRAGRPARRFRSGESLTVRIHWNALRPVADLMAAVGVMREGVRTLYSDSARSHPIAHPTGQGVVECELSPLILGGGSYFLYVFLAPVGRIDTPYDAHIRLYPFEVEGPENRSLHPALEVPCQARLTPTAEMADRAEPGLPM